LPASHTTYAPSGPAAIDTCCPFPTRSSSLEMPERYISLSRAQIAAGLPLARNVSPPPWTGQPLMTQLCCPSLRLSCCHECPSSADEITCMSRTLPSVASCKLLRNNKYNVPSLSAVKQGQQHSHTAPLPGG